MAKLIDVKLRFTTPVLGGMPMNEDIYRDFIASKAPEDQDTEDEIDALTVDDEITKGKTTFPRDEEGYPFLFDYHLKGFFKSACGFMRDLKGTKSSTLKSYKKKIDGQIFVYPREIMFENVTEIRECQRPLRAQTPQGERVALAISDEIPEGAELSFQVECLQDEHEKLIREWLSYGTRNGLCQWRNSGKGRFEILKYDVSDEKGFWEEE